MLPAAGVLQGWEWEFKCVQKQMNQSHYRRNELEAIKVEEDTGAWPGTHQRWGAACRQLSADSAAQWAQSPGFTRAHGHRVVGWAAPASGHARGQSSSWESDCSHPTSTISSAGGRRGLQAPSHACPTHLADAGRAWRPLDCAGPVCRPQRQAQDLLEAEVSWMDKRGLLETLKVRGAWTPDRTLS